MMKTKSGEKMMKTKRFVRIGRLAICCALGMTAFAACTGGD